MVISQWKISFQLGETYFLSASYDQLKDVVETLTQRACNSAPGRRISKIRKDESVLIVTSKLRQNIMFMHRILKNLYA